MKCFLTIFALVILANCTPITNNSETQKESEDSISIISEEIDSLIPFNFELISSADVYNTVTLKELIADSGEADLFFEEFIVNQHIPSHVSKEHIITVYTVIRTTDHNLNKKLYLLKLKSTNPLKTKSFLSVNDLDSFSGTLSIKELTGSLFKAVMFNNGRLIGKIQTESEISETKSKLPVYECFTVTTYHYMDYYYTSGGYTTYSHTELVNITEETVCEEYTPGSSTGGGSTVSEYQQTVTDLGYLESKYLPNMSEREIQIYYNMSLINRFKYLLSGQDASDATQADPRFNYQCAQYNGQGDAVRHAFWNSLLRIRLGKNLAKQLTDAHEDKPAPQDYPEYVKEVEMDLFNNNVGLNGTANNLITAWHEINAAFRTGQLRYLSNLDSRCQATSSSRLVPTNK